MDKETDNRTMPAGGGQQECSFPVTAAIDVIGGKWKMIILWHMLSGTRRYNELRRLIPGISQKMLSQQLRELEKELLVKRKVYPESPPRVEYSITEYGQSLSPVFAALNSWGGKHLKVKDNNNGPST